MLFKKILRNLDEILACFFLTIVIVLTIINVLLRYLYSPIPWAEEVVTICFVWALFLGAAVCFKYKMHMGIDILVEMLPLKLRNILRLGADVFNLLMSGYIAYLSFSFVFSGAKKTSAIIRLPYGYVNASLLVAFGLMTVYGVFHVVRDARIIMGKPVKELADPMEKLQEDFLREQKVLEEAEFNGR